MSSTVMNFVLGGAHLGFFRGRLCRALVSSLLLSLPLLSESNSLKFFSPHSFTFSKFEFLSAMRFSSPVICFLNEVSWASSSSLLPSYHSHDYCMTRILKVRLYCNICYMYQQSRVLYLGLQLGHLFLSLRKLLLEISIIRHSAILPDTGADTRVQARACAARGSHACQIAWMNKCNGREPFYRMLWSHSSFVIPPSPFSSRRDIRSVIDAAADSASSALRGTITGNDLKARFSSATSSRPGGSRYASAAVRG